MNVQVRMQNTWLFVEDNSRGVKTTIQEAKTRVEITKPDRNPETGTRRASIARKIDMRSEYW